MNTGDRYVVYSQDTLYNLGNIQCDEGDSVSLTNQIVTRYRLVNGKFLAADQYQLDNYSTTTYICHVWDDMNSFNVNYLILPAVIIMLTFSVLFFTGFLG